MGRLTDLSIIDAIGLVSSVPPVRVTSPSTFNFKSLGGNHSTIYSLDVSADLIYHSSGNPFMAAFLGTVQDGTPNAKLALFDDDEIYYSSVITQVNNIPNEGIMLVEIKAGFIKWKTLIVAPGAFTSCYARLRCYWCQ